MKYRNLHDLLQHSSSSRSFFVSLPVELQCKLHEHNDYVHTAAELRARAEAVEAHQRLMDLGGWNN